jgi:DNA polymerase V
MADMERPLRLTLDGSVPPILLMEAAGAGFPSPAQDWEETGIDLVELLSLSRAGSYVFRVSGDSMTDAGILDGDTVIVDRDVRPREGSVVVAICDGGFVVRQIGMVGGVPHLVGRNARQPYQPRICDEDVEVWGVARTVVRNLTR